MAVLSPEEIYLNRARFIMKFLGVWVHPSNEDKIQKFHRYLVMSMQYLFLLSQIIYIIQVWGDLEAVSQASYLLFTQASLCFKVTVLQIHNKLVRNLLIQINSDIFKPQNEEQTRILKHQSRRIKRLLFAFMISSQTTCCLWDLKPLFDDVGTRNFPIDVWMPVNRENNFQYVCGYAFQLLTLSMSAFIYFGVDSIALSMVIFACAQLDIIKDKILKINSSTSNNGILTNNSYLEENLKKLKECVRQHQSIISFTEMVENAFHTFLLFQLCGSVGIICMSALRILVIDWRSVQFMSIFLYLSVMISQLFVNCWCGHELTATSEDLHRALYRCAWYEQSPEFKKILLVIMLRMERPLVLRAGHYISLSRPTFVSILRMSYSYFAVLNQTT